MRSSVTPLLPLLALLAGLAAPDALRAQDGFMFRVPTGGFTIRGGPMLYTAGGDLFGEMRDRLTLNRGDFGTPSFGLDIVVSPSARVDFVLSGSRADVRRGSEFERWTELVNGVEVPIRQTTRFRTIPVTASLRYLLVPRGERISELAWIPNRFVPYVGAGAGVAWYKLTQEGDFVDECTPGEAAQGQCHPDDAPPIFSEFYSTNGEGLILHAAAGADFWFAPQFGLNAELRYNHGSAKPDRSFRTYDKVDLGGVQASLGLSIRW